MATSRIRTAIAGVQHHPGSQQWLTGLRDTPRHDPIRLLLAPEPTNRFDKNAIRILNSTGKMLGYVPAVDAPKVLGHLKDRDTLVRCYKTNANFNSIEIQFIKEDPLS